MFGNDDLEHANYRRTTILAPASEVFVWDIPVAVATATRVVSGDESSFPTALDLGSQPL